MQILNREEEEYTVAYANMCRIALAGYHTVATGNQQYMFHAIVGSVLTSLGAYCLYSS